MNELFEDYLLAHPKLVPGILKSLHIRRTHPNYDDYKQEVLCALLKRAQSCLTFEEFDVVAFTYGRCRLLDYLKKENHYTQHELGLPDTYDFFFDEDYAVECLDFYRCLTPMERLICSALQLTSNKKEAAFYLKISRAQLYRHLQNIKEKANFFYER